MFQDGSEGPPTYSRQRCGPRQRGRSLYETALIPVPRRARNPGLPAPKSRKLHPSPRSARNGSSREVATKCRRRRGRQRGGDLAVPAPPGRPDVTLNRHHQLREPLRLLLHSFTYSLTLSSKCFATFPHGTCSLSVSGLYLALRGVYLAL